jgi:hypothetical protein
LRDEIDELAARMERAQVMATDQVNLDLPGLLWEIAA